METTKKLINSGKNKTIGNHSVEILNNSRAFIYHRTAIVVTNEIDKTFNIFDGGWATSSTYRAISSYIYELKNEGYKLIPKDPKSFTSCEANFIKLDTNYDVEYSRKQIAGLNIEEYGANTTIKCEKYLIHVNYSGGETLVTGEYGNILSRLPQYIEKFVG